MSSGVVADKSFNVFVESDELYRELVISKLQMKPEQIKYFDLKFYTKFYTDNEIRPERFRSKFFGYSIGVNENMLDKSILKKAFMYMVNCYCVYTKQFEPETLGVDYSYYESRIFRTTYKENPLRISCWKDLYYLMQSVQKTYKYIESVGLDSIVEDTLDDDSEVKMWINNNSESKEHYVYVRKFIISLLVRNDEQVTMKIDSDGRKHFEVSDLNIPKNGKQILY